MKKLLQKIKSLFIRGTVFYVDGYEFRKLKGKSINKNGEILYLSKNKNAVSKPVKIKIIF